MVIPEYQIAWSVGESSGEQIAASILHEMARLKDCRFRMLGSAGPAMKEVFNGSAISLDQEDHLMMEYSFSWDQEDLAVSGFGDVLFKIPFYIKYLSEWKILLSHTQPDLLVLVDFSGFNEKLMIAAQKMGVKTLVIAPPQIWARKKDRYRRYLETPLICTLPFEKDLWCSLGAKADFLGHPSVGKLRLDENERVDLLICPGSRIKQVERSLKATQNLLSLSSQLPIEIDSVGVLWASDTLKAQGQKFCNFPHESYVVSSSQNVPQAKWVWSNLGTMSLEIALLKLPLSIIHPVDYLTFQIGQRQLQLKSLSLPNILWKQNFISEVIFWHKEWEKVIPQLENAWNQAKSAPYDELPSAISPEYFGESFANRSVFKIREILAQESNLKLVNTSDIKENG